MFRFPVMKSSLCFTDIRIIAVPTTGFANDSRSALRKIQVVLVRKERFDPVSDPLFTKKNFNGHF